MTIRAARAALLGGGGQDNRRGQPARLTLIQFLGQRTQEETYIMGQESENATEGQKDTSACTASAIADDFADLFEEPG